MELFYSGFKVFLLLVFLCLYVSGESYQTKESSDILNILERLERLESSDKLREHENEVQRNDILSLRQELLTRDAVYQKKIDELQTKIHKQAEDQKLLEATIELLSTGPDSNIQERENDFTSRTTKHTALTYRQYRSMHSTSSDANKKRIKRAENEMTVAFFASLTPHLEHAGVNQNIPFDRIVTNVGNAYNGHYGAFNAPVDGIYVFSVTLVGLSSHTSHYSISKNNVAISYIYVRGIEAPYQTASQTFLFQLKKGDDVSIRNLDADESLNGGHYSTFTGFLLQQDYHDTSIVGK